MHHSGPTRDDPLLSASPACRCRRTGEREYGVVLTAFIEADTPEQAVERAMLLRDKVVKRDGGAPGEGVVPFRPGWRWHLQGPDWC